MRSEFMKHFSILLILGVVICSIGLLYINLYYDVGERGITLPKFYESNVDSKGLKISAVSEKIHIDNNWTAAKAAGICTGNGTYSDPYIIEDLVIDAVGSESGIFIENSKEYFKIENCTVLNLGRYFNFLGSGIRLSYVNNSQLINNNCSNNYQGISLVHSNNNTVIGNILGDNRYGLSITDYCINNLILGNVIDYNLIWGIYVNNCDNNTISENSLNYNENGIYLITSYNHTLSGNMMNGCGLEFWGLLEHFGPHKIDTTNLVNGRNLYYYINQVYLNPLNFSNAGQVILVNCNDSVVSNLNTSYYTSGILLFYCNNNTIFKNTANNNNWDGIRFESSHYNNISQNTANNNGNGIRLEDCHYNNIFQNTANNNNRCGLSLIVSNYNIISNNNLIGNYDCIDEWNCEGNIFENNNCGKEEISGYNLLSLICILFVMILLSSKKLKSSYKRKISE